ncbi:hypothetical protein [Streptomyces sp. GESEQ-4]|uniref:hypothetical protein n=1 Tax=Streptomyces sp. GESEQ-4 TaxID=2812655 RepID=UPI001B33B137|nr:hypothetical protein [Streptomyces sp. GESEQ-4]
MRWFRRRGKKSQLTGESGGMAAPEKGPEPEPESTPKQAGKLGTEKSHRIEPHPKCVSCRRNIDPEDLRPDPMGERGIWDIAANLGLTQEDLAGPMADVSAQLYARRCDRCNSWMCHVCVDKVTGHGRRPARHQSCGGIFRPKQVG